MQARYNEVREIGGEVVAVSFSPPQRVAAYLGRHPLPFPVLSDPDRTAYRSFGLGQTTWRDILSGRVLFRYLRMMARGWMPWKPDPGQDLLQLGGDFVLDGRRRIRFAYPSREPTDRPSAETVLDAVRSAAAPD